MMRNTTQTHPSNRHAVIRRSLSLLSLCTLLLTMPGLLNAAATASLDRNSIYTGDTTTLHITTTGDDVGKQPNLTPLQKDFEVLGTSSSSQIRIINGQRSDKHEWLIELAPVTKGTITVPALSVGNSKTSELTLKVSDQPTVATAQAGQPVFIRSEISPSQGDTYVQQQILYTTRLYYRIPLIEGSFTDPKIKNAVVEQLGEDKQYNTAINGQSYQILERRYAIFPEHSGKLTITPTVFNGRTVSETRQRSPFGHVDSMFEQMLNQSGFNDRFFSGTPFGNPGKRIRLGSNTLTLNIKPRPDGYTGPNWLPTQKLTLKDSWGSSPPVIHAGEPVTRTLTLEAKGLEASQLPEIKLSGSNTLRIYPEQPELSNHTDGDWVYGRSEQRFAYVPSQQGKLHFPAVRVTWWNNLKHQQQSTILPAHDVMVLPGSGKAASSTASTGLKTSPANEPAQSSTAITPTTGKTSIDNRLYWLLGGGLGLVVLLVVAFLLLRRQRKPEPASPQIAQNKNIETSQSNPTNDKGILSRSRKSLRDACAKSDPQTAADALLDWAAATWPDQPPRSLGTLAARVDLGAKIIHELETVLYGANEQNWDGQPLWKAFTDGLLRPENQTASKQQTDGAPPLYPDWHKQAS